MSKAILELSCLLKVLIVQQQILNAYIIVKNVLKDVPNVYKKMIA